MASGFYKIAKSCPSVMAVFHLGLSLLSPLRFALLYRGFPRATSAKRAVFQIAGVLPLFYASSLPLFRESSPRLPLLRAGRWALFSAALLFCSFRRRTPQERPVFLFRATAKSCFRLSQCPCPSFSLGSGRSFNPGFPRRLYN